MIALTAVVISAALHFVQHGGKLLTVQSGSMQPSVRRGDAIIVTRVASWQLRIGDIVSYRSLSDAKVIVSHRIVDINSAHTSFTTKGDALKTKDPLVPAANIVGRARGVAPGLGFVLVWLRSPLGLALAVYFPAAVTISWQVYRLIRIPKSSRYSLPGRA